MYELISKNPSKYMLFLHEVGVAVKSALEHFGLIIWIGLILDSYCMKW